MKGLEWDWRRSRSLRRLTTSGLCTHWEERGERERGTEADLGSQPSSWSVNVGVSVPGRGEAPEVDQDGDLRYWTELREMLVTVPVLVRDEFRECNASRTLPHRIEGVARTRTRPYKAYGRSRSTVPSKALVGMGVCEKRLCCNLGYRSLISFSLQQISRDG